MSKANNCSTCDLEDRVDQLNKELTATVVRFALMNNDNRRLTDLLLEALSKMTLPRNQAMSVRRRIGKELMLLIPKNHPGYKKHKKEFGE